MKIVEIKIKKFRAQLTNHVKLTSLMTSFYARIILSVFGIAVQFYKLAWHSNSLNILKYYQRMLQL
jgi:hypothetical protein